MKAIAVFIFDPWDFGSNALPLTFIPETVVVDGETRSTYSHSKLRPVLNELGLEQLKKRGVNLPNEQICCQFVDAEATFDSYKTTLDILSDHTKTLEAILHGKEE